MKVYNKLIRDKIPEIIEAEGKNYEIRTLGEEEFGDFLREKLVEEVREYLESKNPEELADIFEVLFTLVKNHNLTIEEIEKVREKKLKERGGFDKQLCLEKVWD